MIKTPNLFLPPLLFLLLLAACAPTPTAPTETGPAQVSDSTKLIIYSGRSESLVAPVIQQFEDKTGIDVDVRYGSTAELAATLLEEGQNSPADIFYAQDPGGLGVIADAGMLAPLPDAILNRVDGRFRAEDGDWVGISGRARVVVYNTENIDPAELPDDIWAFTDPQWKGRIGWPPTNASFQTMVTAMRKIWGEDKTREWLRGIQANDPIAYEKNTPTVAAVAAGEVDVGFVNHYYLYRFLAEEGEGFTARNYFLPGGGPGSLVMVSGAGRLATGENEENALAFLTYLLSPQAQQYFADETFEYPLIEGVTTPDELTPLSQLNAADIDLADLADLQGTARMLSELGILP